jgi:hypothetical protein
MGNSRPTCSRPMGSRPMRNSRPTRSSRMRSRPTRSSRMRSRPTRSSRMRSRPTRSRPMGSRPTRSRHLLAPRSQRTAAPRTRHAPRRCSPHGPRTRPLRPRPSGRPAPPSPAALRYDRVAVSPQPAARACSEPLYPCTSHCPDVTLNVPDATLNVKVSVCLARRAGPAAAGPRHRLARSGEFGGPAALRSTCLRGLRPRLWALRRRLLGAASHGAQVAPRVLHVRAAGAGDDMRARFHPRFG